MPATPEAQAREEIDRLLMAAGCHVCGAKNANIHAARGVVIREFPLTLDHGYADYLLYVDGKASGVIEAKKVGATLTGLEIQSGRYAKGLPPALPAWRRPLPFLYESTGADTNFPNGLDEDAKSQDVFAFHLSEILAKWLVPLSLARVPRREGSPFAQVPPFNYIPAFPRETIDIIVTVEAHRSIYYRRRPALESFVASLVRPTGTPIKRTSSFFNQNPVVEYGHEQAVAEGMNANHDVYRYCAHASEAESKVEASYYLDLRDNPTRKVRWVQLDENIAFDPNPSGRDVVAVDQARAPDCRILQQLPPAHRPHRGYGRHRHHQGAVEGGEIGANRREPRSLHAVLRNGVGAP
ncbi:MAG: hypothetical protein AB7P08_06680 [Burkholderiales bacterium]